MGVSVYGLTGSAALSGGATTYLFGVVGSAAADGDIVWFDVTCDASAAAQGIKVELFRATGGIPTATTYTPSRLSGGAQARASQVASAWITPVTATPTGLTVIKTWYIPNTGGMLLQEPLSQEDYMIPAASNWVGARVTTPAAVTPNCAYNFAWRE